MVVQWDIERVVLMAAQSAAQMAELKDFEMEFQQADYLVFQMVDPMVPLMDDRTAEKWD